MFSFIFGFMGGFLVAWVFQSFHLYLFLVEDFVKNHVFFKTSGREEGKKKLKKDKKLLEVSIIISARCFYIPTKMLAIMEKFIKNRCLRIVLQREAGVFQDFTCRWCVRFIFPTL